MVVFRQALRGDGLHIGHLSKPGDAEGVVGAHGLEHFHIRVGPLVIEGRFNGVDEIVLLQSHHLRREDPVFQQGVQQQLSQQPDGWLQYMVCPEGEPILQTAHEEAQGLNLSVFPNQGTQTGAV